jgi:hypothetical protein
VILFAKFPEYARRRQQYELCKDHARSLASRQPSSQLRNYADESVLDSTELGHVACGIPASGINGCRSLEGSDKKFKRFVYRDSDLSSANSAWIVNTSWPDLKP